MKIYLAGPLFSTAERDFNARLAAILREKGHEVWLPQESEQESMTPKEIFGKDVEGIDWAEAVVANMDGADPDSGTCYEVGVGNRPTVLYRTDIRSEAPFGPYNLMLHQARTVNRVLDLTWKTVDQIAAALDDALKAMFSK